VTSKERVLRAVAREPQDRTPVDFAATDDTIRLLEAHFGVTGYDAVLTCLGIDLRTVKPRYVGPRPRERADGSFQDVFGAWRRRVPVGGASYDEVVESPLAGVTSASEIRAFPMPRVEWFDFTDVPRQCARYADCAVLSGGTRNDLDIRGYSTFQMPTYLRPMEQLFRDLYLAPDLAHALFQRFADFFLAFYERLFQAARGGIDIFVVLDDYGGQQGPLVSGEAWREFVRPYLAPGIALAKSHGLAVMLHSCGSVRSLIPEFLELGVDILDPIQVQAAGMEPAALVQDFGSRLTFHGSIDIQQTLPFGTPADVRAEVAQRKATLGAKHGLILAPCHNIQRDTPLANILALYGLG